MLNNAYVSCHALKLFDITRKNEVNSEEISISERPFDIFIHKYKIMYYIILVNIHLYDGINGIKTEGTGKKLRVIAYFELGENPNQMEDS